MSNVKQFIELINGFEASRILVIGDLLLDVYLKGMSTRLCPEAPVPVVDVCERTVLPGGAANTVCNLKSLGASVVFCSVIGKDAEGDEALQLLRRFGVHSYTIVRSQERKTITKSRVVSGAQVITRIDQGSDQPIDDETSRVLIRLLEEAYAHCDAIVISDYDKGVITEAVVEKLIELQKSQPKFVAIDSKRLPFFSGLEASFIKPNYGEFVELLGLPSQSVDRVGQVAANAEMLFARIPAKVIAVTLDKDGCVIAEKGKVLGVLNAAPVTKPHVAGAGDTFVGAFVLAYLNSFDSYISAQIATAAATIAVQKECTAACSQAELKSYFNLHTKFIADLDDLREISNAYRQSGKRIVFTNGCFDILHSGHVTYLHRAREQGDVLIVGLNTDASIRRIKGEKRPINGLADRLQVLAGLSSVDHIVAFGDETDDTPVPLISIIRPHVFAKGGDYTKETLPEATTVEACGGEIIFIDHIPNHSTTRIINRINHVSESVDTVFSDRP